MTFDARPVGGLRRLLTAGAILVLAAPAALDAQSHVLHQEGYIVPAEEIAALVDAPRHENVLLTNLGPDGRFFLNSESEGLPTLEDFARPYYRLGGLEVDPAAHRSRSLTARGAAGFELISAEDGSRVTIQAPADAKVSGARWSPDGSRIAFLANGRTETHVYVAEVSNGRSRQVTRAPLLATRVSNVEWSGDGRYLFAVVVPEGRGSEPAPPAQPSTPLVRITSSDENRLRTYPSLLKDPHDQALLEHHTTGQLVRIEVANRRVENLGRPAMIEAIDPSPDGTHMRVRTTRRPFSYIVPTSQFGDLDEVWALDGEALVELEKRDVRLGVPDSNDDNGNDTPRRAITWRPDGAGLSFLQREAAPAREEAGDDEPEEEEARPRQGSARKDRVMQWLPPFDDDGAVVVFESENEIRAVRYSADARWLFLTERQRDTETVYAVHLDDPETRYTITEWDTEDFHANPGTLMGTTNELGASVVRLSSDGEHVFLSGTRFAEDPEAEAPRPFVDRVEIRTGEAERIFESSPDVFERVTAVLDDDFERLMLARESATMVPDSWLLDRSSGELRQLTQNVDPHPAVTNARRERVTVTRPDGIRFKVDVTLPPDWQEGERLPALFWFYPREYDDQEAYDRSTRTYNKNRFPSAGARSMEIMTAAGYAVVQPDHPIIGPRATVNNNYVVDLRANLLTVIDALDARGFIDRRRLALGGHSYGGFGTINAMVQTPYFRAGIAGAPNSNRLLTPIGFQSERRALWEAREVYTELSPFMYAERLSGALLIYHGEDDQNVGTFPDNSWRLIHALEGLGKTAALYMYPYEGHGPATRESLLDMWARWIAWLDHYVKDADVDEPVAPLVVVTEDVDVDR